MAGRGRTTFRKRQKETARKEKQRMKDERRAQRKLAAQSQDGGQLQDACSEPTSETDENRDTP